MNGLTAYKYYQAIKLHFTSDKYDVFTSKGHVRCSRESFEKRNDRYIFEKLATKFRTDKELIQYLASNFMYGHHEVVYNQVDGDRNYITFLKRKQSITQVFTDDLHKLDLDAGELNKTIFDCTNNQLPIIISYLLNKRITLETLSICNDINGFIEKIDSDLVRTMYGDILRAIQKSHKFIKYDSTKLVPIYMEAFKE